jgi:hypothetical protein
LVQTEDWPKEPMSFYVKYTNAMDIQLTKLIDFGQSYVKSQKGFELLGPFIECIEPHGRNGNSSGNNQYFNPYTDTFKMAVNLMTEILNIVVSSKKAVSVIDIHVNVWKMLAAMIPTKWSLKGNQLKAKSIHNYLQLMIGSKELLDIPGKEKEAASSVQYVSDPKTINGVLEDLNSTNSSGRFLFQYPDPDVMHGTRPHDILKNPIFSKWTKKPVDYDRSYHTFFYDKTGMKALIEPGILPRKLEPIGNIPAQSIPRVVKKVVRREYNLRNRDNEKMEEN